MMGKDCEKMLCSLNAVIDAANEAIERIARLNTPPIKIKSDHTHYDEGKGNAAISYFVEKENKISMTPYLSMVKSKLSNIEGYLSKMDKLEEGLYTDVKEFNNSVGSPWTEIKRLRKWIDKVESFKGEDYTGDRICAIALLTAVTSSAVDAKWALVMYHDYIQRGFDNIFNDNTPSITFKKNYKTDELDVKETTGQRNQRIEENVHIKKQNYDPF